MPEGHIGSVCTSVCNHLDGNGFSTWIWHLQSALLRSAFSQEVSIQKSRAGAECSVLTAAPHLVLQAFSVYWEVLPFCLFVSIPLLVLSRITAYALEQNLYHFLLAATVVIVSFLIIFLPEVSMYVPRRPQLSTLELEMVGVETHVGLGFC
jgi:hypothetical protein